MKNPALRSALWLAPLALAACNNKPTVVNGPEDPMANAIANAAPVELPPPIAATISYRCSPDNSLVTVDWFKGDMQVTLHPTSNGEPVHLKADKQGGPFTAAGGYKLSGDQKKINWNEPNKPEKTCHV